MSLISYNARIHFADNAFDDALEEELGALGLTRPLVIADDGPERAGLGHRMRAALGPSARATFWTVGADGATEAACDAAAAVYREIGADGVVGFGGRTALTLAKAVGLRANHDGPLFSYACQRGGSARIRARVPPIVAIPTTPDACSEISSLAVVTGSDGAHVSIASDHLLPRVAICDPTLTLDLRPERMASAAMDIITHCIETFSARAYNPPADGIARDGLRRAGAHVDPAVEGSDLHARREMMAAALDGGLASQKGLGAVHALSHALSGVADGPLDHGAVNAILLPHVIAFNAPAVGDRYSDIRSDLGLGRDADLALAISRLRRRIGLPSRLRALGLRADTLDRAALAASSDYSSRTNPRLANAGDYLGLLMAAY